MAQVFDASSGRVIVRSDIQTPADASGSQLPRTIVQVENFIDPNDVPTTMDFVLDERFRERALQVLLDRSTIVSGSVGIPTRDLANFIPVDLTSTSPVYITALMKSPFYVPEAVNKIINRTFNEFV